MRWYTYTFQGENQILHQNLQVFDEGLFSNIKVANKISDLTYLVNCDPRVVDNVIHVDRIRKKRAQILSGENNEPLAKLEDPEDSASIDCDDD